MYSDEYCTQYQYLVTNLLNEFNEFGNFNGGGWIYIEGRVIGAQKNGHLKNCQQGEKVKLDCGDYFVGAGKLNDTIYDRTDVSKYISA